MGILRLASGLSLVEKQSIGEVVACLLLENLLLVDLPQRRSETFLGPIREEESDYWARSFLGWVVGKRALKCPVL